MRRHLTPIDRIRKTINILSTKENLKKILEEHGYVVNGRYEVILPKLAFQPSIIVRIAKNGAFYNVKTRDEVHAHIAELLHFENVDVYPELYQAEKYVLEKLVQDAWQQNESY